MSETAEDDEGYVDEEALEAAVPRRQTPLLPEAGASGTPLMIVIAVLAFIASVSLAGYFMVSRAAADWTGDLSGTITVQVRGAAADLILQDADIAEGLLRDHPGVTEVARMSRAETEELLEPWLGRDNLSADIPIPIIITAEISPSLRRDLSSLRNGLAEAAPLAALYRCRRAVRSSSTITGVCCQSSVWRRSVKTSRQFTLFTICRRRSRG